MGSKPAGYKSPWGQVIVHGFLAQQPTKYLRIDCQILLRFSVDFEDETYVPVPQAHQSPPEGHVGPKAGREEEDIS